MQYLITTAKTAITISFSIFAVILDYSLTAFASDFAKTYCKSHQDFMTSLIVSTNSAYFLILLGTNLNSKKLFCLRA